MNLVDSILNRLREQDSYVASDDPKTAAKQAKERDELKKMSPDERTFKINLRKKIAASAKSKGIGADHIESKNAPRPSHWTRKGDTPATSHKGFGPADDKSIKTSTARTPAPANPLSTPESSIGKRVKSVVTPEAKAGRARRERVQDIFDKGANRPRGNGK